MKRIIISSGILFLILFIGIKYFQYFDNQLDIIYVENSLLHKYYNDFYIANKQKLPFDKFLKVIKKEDKRIYSFLDSGKF